MASKQPTDCACCFRAIVGDPVGSCLKCASDSKHSSGALCGACYGRHHDGLVRFEGHIARLGEYPEVTLLSKVGLVSAPAMCSVHAHKQADAICRESGCAGHALVCGACMIASHKGHDLEGIDIAAQDKSAGLMRAVFAPTAGIAAPSDLPVELSSDSVQSAMESTPAVTAVRTFALAVAAK